MIKRLVLSVSKDGKAYLVPEYRKFIIVPEGDEYCEDEIVSKQVGEMNNNNNPYKPEGVIFSFKTLQSLTEQEIVNCLNTFVH